MAVVDAGAARRVPRGLRQVGRHWPPSSARSPTRGRLRMNWHGELIVDLPPRTAAARRPGLRAARSSGRSTRTRCSSTTAPACRGRATATSCAPPLLRLVGSPNLADKSWVTDQYDRYVLGNTVLAQPEDAGMVRLDESTNRGIALSTDGNGRYARLDPYAGAQLALAEAYRNVATTGARPLAVTNCLNFGSPEDPAVMWQFAEAVRGLADGCQALGTPVTGGNVSFYNQTGVDADPADAGHRRARRHRRRRAPHADRLPRRRRADLPARRHPRRVRRLGVGARRARLPRRPAAGGRPRPRAAAGRRPHRRRAATGCSTPRTTCPRAAWRRRWSRRACARTSAPASCCPRRRPVRRAVQRVGRPRDREPCRAARRSASPTCAPPAACRRRASASSTCSSRRSTCRTCSASRCASCARPGPATLPDRFERERRRPRRRAARREVEAFAAQAADLADWLEALPAEAFDAPSVLDGWDVRTLVGHLVLTQQGFARGAAEPHRRSARSRWPTTSRAYRRGGRRDRRVRPAHHARRRRCRSPLTRLRDGAALRDGVTDVPDRAVLDGPRGPITALDWALTRVVDLVVHCDDLSRSLPDHAPLADPPAGAGVGGAHAGRDPRRPGAGPLGRGPRPAVRGRAGGAGAAAHARHAAERRRDRRPHLAAPGHRPHDFADAVRAGAVRASGNRADLSDHLPVLS